MDKEELSLEEERVISEKEARVTIRGLFKSIERIVNPILEPKE